MRANTHPDITDGAAWRCMTPERLGELMAEQLPRDVRESAERARDVRRDVVEGLVEQLTELAEVHESVVMDDEAKANWIFLVWLSWNLDHKLIPRELLSDGGLISPPGYLPGRRRIRDALSDGLMVDTDDFTVMRTNWSGAGAVEVLAETANGDPFRFRVEVVSVRGGK